MNRSTLAALTLGPLLCMGGAGQAGAEEVVLENRHVRRVLVRDGDAWRTARLSRGDGADPLEIASDEFLIALVGGRELTIADYTCPDAPRVEPRGTGHGVTLRCQPIVRGADPPAPDVTIEYWLDHDEPYLRKALHLTFPERAAVDRLAVERFRTPLPCDQGGRGEPVFVGDTWFVGLEYPGSEATHAGGLVMLSHAPGRAPQDPGSGRCLIHSKTAVAGVGAAGDPIELAFGDYLETIRRPSRILLHYNSWYDFRTTELTQDNLVATFESFKTHVLDPFGLHMDVFVPDDGWQAPQSIWVPRRNLYPMGFHPLADALRARDTRLGLWLPFNGFNLDVEWGAARGYEKSNQGRYYCLAGPKYNADLRKMLARHIAEGDVGYFKHDFNQLRCSAEGHGHLPDERHGHEAALDAELDLLALERRLQPDVHLNVTSYVWHSPWWLAHADTIWMAAGDFGYNNDWPQLSPREWAMSYRDAHFHKLYAERRTLVPLSAMMTHGLIHGRYQLLGGEDETLREWSDYVVMYYGRGVQLMEWYITPDLMTRGRWDVLGHATRWAIENREVLENVVLVGGDPRLGQAYGYAHWSGERGILVLRNPDVRQQDIEIPFDKSVRFRGAPGGSFQGRWIYPYVERLPEILVSGQPIRLSIPGGAVLVAELAPQVQPGPEPAAPPAAVAASAETLRAADGGSTVRVQVRVPDEDLARCDLYFVTRGRFRAAPHWSATLDGGTVAARLARGPDWTLQSLDLRAYRGRDVEVLWAGAADQPFSRPDLQVDVTLVLDRAVAGTGGEPSSEHLPLPISAGHRRQTVQLLAGETLAGRVLPRALSESDVAGIKAARLRICVFDSNGEPSYRDKFILLQGEQLGRVPANSGALSTWQAHVVDIPPEHLARLRRVNDLRITNPAGDYFKIAGLALAVQVADGTWIETLPHEAVHSSTAQWYHAEGTPFVDGRSEPIELRFD